MIRPNEYLENLVREPQHFDERCGIIRLDMNEYVPFPDQKLYEKWKEPNFRRSTRKIPTFILELENYII